MDVALRERLRGEMASRGVLRVQDVRDMVLREPRSWHPLVSAVKCRGDSIPVTDAVLGLHSNLRLGLSKHSLTSSAVAGADALTGSVGTA